MGEEFSKKALERHRKDGKPLKCKKCVSAAEQEERDRAEARRRKEAENNHASKAASEDDNESRSCAGACGKDLPKSAYNRNQWSKGESKSRCRECVEQAVKDEATEQAKAKEEKIELAKGKVEEAKKSGNQAKILAAESELAALEAEKVTGLKPVKLSSRGGRGGRGGRGIRSGGRGRGRGKR